MRKLPLTLVTAFGAFGIGTTELSSMGPLLVIAQGVDVSTPMAGLLISAYAIGVMTSVAAISALWFALPQGERGVMPDVRREFRVLTTQPAVPLAMATTVMGAGAMFTL